MRQSIITLAGERAWSETRQRWLERAARRAGISYRAAKGLFYGEPHEPRAGVVESVRRAVERMSFDQEAKAKDEYAALSKRIAELEQRVMAPDTHN
jgi:tetrahydromethanopterin S-methyltransferase subunit G